MSYSITQEKNVNESVRTKLNDSDGKKSVAYADGRVFCTSFDSRIGHMYIASTEKGLCKLSIPKETKKDFFTWLESHFEVDAVIDNKSHNKEYIEQINRYLNGKLVEFTFPLDLIGTPFQLRVWKKLSQIPYGVTITYSQLAKKVGVPKGFQAVGRANGSNPLPIVIPCHRVIGSDGSLIGYSSGVKTKEFLLRLEGAIIL
jgi:O-6-methylguanine DNA methyltransferase